jgi:serine/threonine protein kinase
MKIATLIDWCFGCQISEKMSPLVGARMWRSPEMLLNFSGFGSTADIWAVGVLILDILTGHKLPWNASNAWLEVAEMTKIFGGVAIRNYAKELGVKIQDVALEKFVEEPIETFEGIIVREDLKDEGWIEIMKDLLTLNYQRRLTAQQALEHPFFQVT